MKTTIRWLLMVPAFILATWLSYAIIGWICSSMLSNDAAGQKLYPSPYGGMSHLIAMGVATLAAVLVAPSRRGVIGIGLSLLLMAFAMHKSSPSVIFRETGVQASSWPMLSWPLGALLAAVAVQIMEKIRREPSARPYGSPAAGSQTERPGVRHGKRMKIFVIIGIVAASLAGCKVPDEVAVLRKAASQVHYPRGSRVQYATVPAGIVFQQTALMGSTNAITLRDEGIVLVIDEQPKQDWAHSFQLVFVPKTTGIPQSLFHGSAIPGFSFKEPDGRIITKWKKR